MPQMDAEKMRSVNVVMTSEMIAGIDQINRANRSAVVRKVVSAIMAAHSDGQQNPFNLTVDYALRSAARNRRIVQKMDVTWKKSIIWLPERMHTRLDRMISPYGLRVADFIRGAMMGYTGIDPMAGLDDGAEPKGDETHPANEEN